MLLVGAVLLQLLLHHAPRLLLTQLLVCGGPGSGLSGGPARGAGLAADRGAHYTVTTVIAPTVLTGWFAREVTSQPGGRAHWPTHSLVIATSQWTRRGEVYSLVKLQKPR